MTQEWASKNQKYMVSFIDYVKELLRNSTTQSGASSTPPQGPVWDAEANAPVHTASMPAIEQLSAAFGLSEFEKSLLVLCSAVELDSEVPKLCAKVNGNPDATFATFSLALSVLPDAHWSALVPTSPLRRFRLIELYGQGPVTGCQLRIDERVLHYLVGISYLDKSVHGLFEPVATADAAGESQRAIALSIVNAWKYAEMTGGQPLGIIQLVGPDEASKKQVAGQACGQLGLNLWQIAGDLLPSKADELEALTQLWIRESVLLRASLYICAHDVEQSAAQKLVTRFAGRLSGLSFLSRRDASPADTLPALSFNVSKPTKAEQRAIWQGLLLKDVSSEKAELCNQAIVRAVNQFNLNIESIQSAAYEAHLSISGGEQPASAIWHACQKVALPRLPDLAQRIVPHVTLEDIVLPDREKDLLGSIVATVRQRYKVYEEWGFGMREGRGLGIAALFAGDSGTGKTMSAEAIAGELGLDLYRIDLSMVVSKYIGETEKNLRRVFDAAEDGGAILFFDEADALFGKRSEVKDSHDRYANIEVGYLLQRIETYRGLAILTTNMKGALDSAFVRRIKFLVNFPFPDERSRKEIWKKIMPKAALGNKPLDYDLLARLDVTGGGIYNIALTAAFLAADEETQVEMRHVMKAAKQEYDKMERPMPEIGWSKS
ncbi:AAA+ family ATPase [Candidatus Nitrososphaera evergladensis SR1]|uniref:AAA+ family ATPase n=1 Tax=Candidatus Nitrososphaera evergladensis SR1 TaxID=1459636 RepID=A0A075MM70_9ARCH|nr:ATP-binding protein [Candidatus Nitrososphaera evergladensis]AIF82581.1 AAA+ family ATPase [Candidatus Nitrososphaera evergladensis SR1]